VLVCFLCNKEENFINVLKIGFFFLNLNPHKHSVSTTKLINFVYTIQTNRLIEFRKIIYFFFLWCEKSLPYKTYIKSYNQPQMHILRTQYSLKHFDLRKMKEMGNAGTYLYIGKYVSCFVTVVKSGLSDENVWNV
jgi:hypothetical protein